MDRFQRYRGRVVRLGTNCAFIDRDTAVTLDGSTYLYTKHDIFVHKNDFEGGDFKVGMELSFRVAEDSRSRNKGALRAGHVLLYGVELQFPEKYVDHPSVAVTWCFKPAVFEYIKSRPEHTFALVIGAVIPGAPSNTKVLETNIGLDALKDGASFISFYAPGEYEIYVYLVEYQCSERVAKKALTEFDVGRYEPKTDRGVAVSGGYDLPFLGHRDIEGALVAVSTLSLSVPDGIFAKPMTGRTLKWFQYFWKDDLLDDCDRRGKQWFAFTLGIPAFVIWELLKRVYFFFWGISSFLLGNHPGFAWKQTFSSDLSADYSFVKYATRQSLMDYKGCKQNLRPLTVLGLTWLTVAPFLLPYVWVLYAVVVGVASAVYLGVAVWQRFFHKTEEEVLNKKYEVLEASLLCGAQTENRPISVRLFWTGIKREVCRTYKR